MKKYLYLFLTLVIASALLCSCNPPEKEEDGDAPNAPAAGTGFFGEGKQFYFVEGEGVSLQGSIEDIYFDVLYSTYQYPIYIASGDRGGECEIVFGKADRAISKEAYSKLDRYLTGVENESGWLIYVKNNSICVAFDTKQAMRKAVEYLDANLLKSDFDSNKGVVAYENFDRLEAAAEERAAKQAEGFAVLEAKIGANGVEALKNLYSLYDENLYIWMANLYCPDVGGFYYSNSGRNTEGFLPDIESTKQILSFINTSGMLEDYPTTSYSAALLADYPEIAEQILNFAIGLQAEDGYFYHPQWGKDIITSRQGRDLTNAQQVIAAFGGTARYPYPSVQVPETDGDAVGASAKLTGRFLNSGVSAVSKVVATAAPAYLQSLDKWKAYIDSLEIDEGNSYAAGNTLNSQLHLIKTAEDEYKDYLINYLNSTQKENGTWEDEISYDSVNGLMKLSSVYLGLNAQMPRLKEAANSCIVRCIDLSLRPVGFDTTCDNYNPWYSLMAILRMAGSTPLRTEIRQMIYDNFTEMINSTTEKISRYKKDDGSFSYNINHTSATSQGAVVAVSGTNEGDVNATCLSSTGPLHYIFNCLASDMVPLYCAGDFEIFMDTICDLGSIIKDPAPDPTPITFDDYDTSVDQTVNGIVQYPDDMMEVVIRDKDMENGEYKWLDCQIEKAPASKHEDDNALKFEVITKPCVCTDDPCSCKKVASTAQSVQTQVQNSTIAGNAFVAEFDFYLDSWGESDKSVTIYQLTFTESIYGGASLKLNMDTYTGSDGKNYIKLWDDYAGLDGMKNSSLVEGIPAQEWVRFRFELYKTKQSFTNEASGEVKQYQANVCKIYVNDKYVAESDAAQIADDGTTINKAVKAFSISGYRSNSSVAYIDNMLVYKTNDKYVCEEEPGSSVLDNMAVDKNKTVATFEDGKTATYYLKNLAVPGYIKYSVEEKEGKTALHVDKYGIPSASTYTQATLSNRSDIGECYTYETKIYYDAAKMTSGNYVSQFSVSASNSLSFLGFNLKFCGTYVELIHNKNYLNGSSIESSGVVKRIDGEPMHLPVDQWFTFKLEFYRAEVASESMVKIYIGDANGEDMELWAEFNAYKTDSTVDVQRFVFTHYRAVSNISVYLDDISFTRSDKEFVSDLPDEHVDKFTEGYVSGDVRISDNTADTSYAGSDSVSAAKDPKNNTNNVMKITSSSESGVPYIITVKHSGSQITNGLSAFETKLFVESAGNGAFATIAFVGTNGAVQELTLNKGADGKVFIAVPDGYTVTLNDFTSSNSKNKLTLGEWNTLRVEFTNADDAADAYVEVFINGASVGKLVGYKSTQNVHTVTVTGAGVNSVMYLDDISYREFLLAKEPTGGAGADESTTVTAGETFDKLGGNLVGDGSDSKVKFGKGTCAASDLTYTQPDDTIVVTTDPTGAENDVLMFRDGSVSSHSTLFLAYSGSQVVNGISVFETKLYIPKSEIVGGSIIAQLSFNKGRTAQFNLNLNAYSDKSQVYFVLNDTEGSETGRAITTDAWHTLRLEYYNYADKTKSCVKVYIDNLYAGSIAAGTADDCNAFFWKGYSSGLSTVYFDNMSLTEKKAD